MYGEKIPESQEPNAVRSFYREVFGWSRASYDTEINGWIIYSEDESVPPRVVTRRDKIGRILEASGIGDEDEKKGTIATFETTDIAGCCQKIRDNNGAVIAEGPGNPEVSSRFAACQDDRGYQFTLVQLDEPYYDQRAVAEILRHP
jgi:predicted enzyme related to lactoylglutathione lyase